MDLTLSLIKTPPQQTTFENFVTKGGIAQNEQFLLLPQCFQLYIFCPEDLSHLLQFFVSGKGLMKHIRTTVEYKI